MIAQKSRLKDFYHKSLSKEYNVAVATHYKPILFLEKPRDTTEQLPWKRGDIGPHNLKAYEEIRDSRPFVKNPVSKPVDMYDLKTGIFQSNIEFGRGIYPEDTFKPAPKKTINM